jgi:hypothetical protein
MSSGSREIVPGSTVTSGAPLTANYAPGTDSPLLGLDAVLAYDDSCAVLLSVMS